MHYLILQSAVKRSLGSEVHAVARWTCRRIVSKWPTD